MKIIFPLILLFSFHSIAQTNSTLDSISSEVKKVLGEDWFLVQKGNGFEIFFCRSCQENYYNSNQSLKNRYDFFTVDKADSISYYPTVSTGVISPNLSVTERKQQLQKFYSTNDLLSFEVILTPIWDKEKQDSVQRNNKLLEQEILKDPIYKTSMAIFSDYRFWLPDDNLKERTSKYPFYFERLPYESGTLDYSIFIIQDKSDFFTEACYVDKNDPEYYLNTRNFLEYERVKTLKAIALALGITDFRIINSDTVTSKKH